MHCIKKEAINSVNETIQSVLAAQRKHESQEHFITVVSFNNDVKTIYDCVPATEVKQFTDESYQPDCCTALYDAMGLSLNALRKRVTKDDKVLVTVVTDGEENASLEYSGEAIKALVDELKANGWVFAYIGANQDVVKVAASISITNTLAFETTSHGAARMIRRVEDGRSRWFDKVAKGESSAALDNHNFFDDEDI